MTETLILASGSPFRKAMLENAGLSVEAFPASIDERAVELALEGTGSTPEDVALVLAEAKALRGQRRAAGRAGAWLRPDPVAGRRTCFTSLPTWKARAAICWRCPAERIS